MAYTKPDATAFKAYFDRDFPFGSTIETVRDADIDKAIGEASVAYNEALFSSQANFTIGFMYLIAHYLVMDLRASSQGIAGEYSWLRTSKAAGSVSEGITVPQYILDHPVLSMLSKTNYGAKYLALILGSAVGAVSVVCGGTQA